MALIDAAGRSETSGRGGVAAGARRALAHERAGRFREAWRAWEELRAANPSRTDWNGPLAASYLRFAFDWTADGSEGSLQEVEEALLRGMSILTIDVAARADDVARLMLIARACEQRCVLRAFGEGWTRAVREALDAGDAVRVTGERRQVVAAGAAAAVALDLVAISAPSLAALAGELAQSCLRLAAILEASGADDEAQELTWRAEAVLRGPQPPRERPRLTVIEGGRTGEPVAASEPRPALRIVTTPTA